MIPVLTFHSIGVENSSWTRSYLSSPLKHFIEFCKYLKDENYDTIFFDEWYELQYLNSNNRKKIVLTFDDGYLDNWVYVFPVIKKHGIKITIFVNPEFVDRSSRTRSTLEDTWNNKLPENQLKPLGFLNWKEMRHMEASALVDIQSHSMTHDTYFKSDKLIDLFDGSKKYDWLCWLYYKEKKPYYIEENLHQNVPHGVPIFESDRSLSVRRFFPSEDILSYCISEYQKKCNKHNLSNRKKKTILEEIKKELKNGQNMGRYETDDELHKRYKYELEESKRILEEKLEKNVRYLCWPGGRYNEKSLRMSIEAGYTASTVTKKSEGDMFYSDNKYQRIHRIHMGSNVKTSRNILMNKSNRGLIYCFKENTGLKYERVFLKNKRRLFKILPFKS
jgi:peptidoglycan/xylan/chitin deacetylase (PgdA/CDA1 family)